MGKRTISSSGKGRLLALKFSDTIFHLIWQLNRVSFPLSIFLSLMLWLHNHLTMRFHKFCTRQNSCCQVPPNSCRADKSPCKNISWCLKCGEEKSPFPSIEIKIIEKCNRQQANEAIGRIWAKFGTLNVIDFWDAHGFANTQSVLKVSFARPFNYKMTFHERPLKA